MVVTIIAATITMTTMATTVFARFPFLPLNWINSFSFVRPGRAFFL